jgi:2-polyprenyl-3-methyl-5-hydroxy-6-metoxy-1,4-benzoquinol methylase
MTSDLSSIAHKNEHCRVCNNPLPNPIIDLGNQPLANAYIKKEDLDKEEPLIPLQLAICSVCDLAQLTYVVKPELMFSNYLYVSGTTSTLKAHWKDLINDITNDLWYIKNGNLKVLDIACNDGSLLKVFQESIDKKIKLDLWGVDPAENLHKLSSVNVPDAKIICGYWGTEHVRKAIPKKYFDVITACNVFAHVDYVHSFLCDAIDSLATTGSIYIEMPYFSNTIEEFQFDQIYLEHLSYFSLNQMVALAHQVGLEVVDATLHAIHGGSMVYRLVRKKEANLLSDMLYNEARLAGAFKQECESKIDGKLNKFASKLKLLKYNLTDLVYEDKQLGNKVIGYGASAKGNTILNYCDELAVDYIVDDNSMKVGLYTPGRHVEIKPVSYLAEEEGPLTIVLFAWNFKEEIIEKIKAQRGSKETSIINYVPEVHLEIII